MIWVGGAELGGRRQTGSTDGASEQKENLEAFSVFFLQDTRQWFLDSTDGREVNVPWNWDQERWPIMRTFLPAKVVVDKQEGVWLLLSSRVMKQVSPLSLGGRLIDMMTFKDPHGPRIHYYIQTSHSEFSACCVRQCTGSNLFSGWSHFWPLIHSTLHAPFPARPGPSFSLPLPMAPRPNPGFRRPTVCQYR